jgi:hypothetical protein
MQLYSVAEKSAVNFKNLKMTTGELVDVTTTNILMLITGNGEKRRTLGIRNSEMVYLLKLL